jgi:hypothetical protein
METDRLFRRLGVAVLGLLFGAAFWLRLTSYNTAPEFSADEAIYGLQTLHVLRGELSSVRMSTATGHLLCPFLMMLQAPLLASFEPSSTLLRLPITLCGIASVGLAYRLGSRTYDRTTGLIAAGLLAVLPAAIIYSRIAWEPGLIPLYSILGLSLAYRGSRLGVFALLLVGYPLVHPTTIMLAPILTSVLLTQVVRRTFDQPIVRWRAPLITLAGAIAVTVPVVLIGQSSQGAGWARTYYDVGPCDWGRFLGLYEQALLGLGIGTPPETVAWYHWRFWSIVSVVSLLGLERLIQRRAWDQLVLIASTFATLVGLYVAVGPYVVNPVASRYTVFLLVPIVLSFACLLRTLIVSPTTRGRAGIRALQFALCLTIGFALLGTAKTRYIDGFRTREPAPSPSWAWSVRGEEIKPVQQIAELIQRDSRDGLKATVPRRIAAGSFWFAHAIKFLSFRRPDLRIEAYDYVPAQERVRKSIGVLKSGGYVVNFQDFETDRLIIAAFPPDAMKVWIIPTSNQCHFLVYRLHRKPQTL